MTHRMRRLLRATLLALTVLCATASTATADVFVTRPGGRFTATASNLTFTSGLLTVTCSATLTGTLAASTPIAARGSMTVGSVTSLTFGTCSPSTVRLASLGLPWTLEYTDIVLDGTGGMIGFRFSIPNVQISATSPFGPCLFAGRLPYEQAVNASGQAGAMTLLSNTLVRQSGGCGTSATARGFWSWIGSWFESTTPGMSLGPSDVDFAAAPGTPQIVTIHNLSDRRAVDLFRLDVTGADSGAFRYDLAGVDPADQCVIPGRLALLTSCQVLVEFVGGPHAPPFAASLDLFLNNDAWIPVASATLRR